MRQVGGSGLSCATHIPENSMSFDYPPNPKVFDGNSIPSIGLKRHYVSRLSYAGRGGQGAAQATTLWQVCPDRDCDHRRGLRSAMCDWARIESAVAFSAGASASGLARGQ